MDEPYAAMAEICRRPLAYRAMILSLASLYREELGVIAAVKRRWPHVDIWLTQTDGRHAALADAMRLGADGLLSEDGLHRTAAISGTIDPFYAEPQSEPASAISPVDSSPGIEELNASEPILTADELRALLAEHPVPDDDGRRDARTTSEEA